MWEAIEKFEFRDVQDEIYEVAREVIYKRIFGEEGEERWECVTTKI